MAQNQILGKMQGMQWPKTGFYENCRACKGSKPGFTRIAGHAMAQNRVLREMQGVQRPKTGFYEDCRACNGPKPGFTRIAGHAMAQKQRAGAETVSRTPATYKRV